MARIHRIKNAGTYKHLLTGTEIIDDIVADIGCFASVNELIICFIFIIGIISCVLGCEGIKEAENVAVFSRQLSKGYLLLPFFNVFVKLLRRNSINTHGNGKAESLLPLLDKPDYRCSELFVTYY